MVRKLERFDLAGPLALIGIIALASGLWRWWSFRLDAEASVPIGLGLVMLLAAAPGALNRTGLALPAWKPRTWALGIGGIAAVAAMIVGGRVIANRPGGLSLGAFGTIAAPPAKSTAADGRAQVLSGDTLRVSNIVYRLSGVEAPERQQDCMRPGKRRWRCGEAAMTALEKATRGKPIACAASGGADAAGRTPATCKVEGRDIAADLVREGHVFALSALFGGYSSAEAEARQKKAGIWNGESERPSDYRAKAWDAAKKASPDGCPIKAVVNNGSKTYVVPGAKDYRKTTVRTGKGERWFCSEADAAAAGWKSAERG